MIGRHLAILTLSLNIVSSTWKNRSCFQLSHLGKWWFHLYSGSTYIWGYILLYYILLYHTYTVRLRSPLICVSSSYSLHQRQCLLALHSVRGSSNVLSFPSTTLFPPPPTWFRNKTRLWFVQPVTNCWPLSEKWHSCVLFDLNRNLSIKLMSLYFKLRGFPYNGSTVFLILLWGFTLMPSQLHDLHPRMLSHPAAWRETRIHFKGNSKRKSKGIFIFWSSRIGLWRRTVIL